jgi:hypothetical protein
LEKHGVGIITLLLGRQIRFEERLKKLLLYGSVLLISLHAKIALSAVAHEECHLCDAQISSFDNRRSVKSNLNLFSPHSRFNPGPLGFIFRLDLGALVHGYVQRPFGRFHGAEVNAPRVAEKCSACQNARDFVDYLGAV